jgi:hypothetical protein
MKRHALPVYQLVRLPHLEVTARSVATGWRYAAAELAVDYRIASTLAGNGRDIDRSPACDRAD